MAIARVDQGPPNQPGASNAVPIALIEGALDLLRAGSWWVVQPTIGVAGDKRASKCCVLYAAKLEHYPLSARHVLHPGKLVEELWTGEALSVAYCDLDLIEQAFGPRTGRLNRTIAGVNPW